MLTGTVWGITLVVAGLVATIAAAQILLAALFPRRMARTRAALGTRGRLFVVLPIGPSVNGALLSFLVGLPAVGILVAVPAAIGKAFEFGGALGFSFSILVAVLGLGCVAAEIGRKLPSRGAASHPWRGMLRGSVALSLASLLPVAGWFAVFPVSVVAGVGAWVRSFFLPDTADVVPDTVPADDRAPAEPEPAGTAA